VIKELIHFTIYTVYVDLKDFEGIRIVIYRSCNRYRILRGRWRGSGRWNIGNGDRWTARTRPGGIFLPVF
jgi:hypothetical protein